MATVAEMVLELEALTLAGAVHDSMRHELVMATKDKGEMSFCPGCRQIVLTRRIAAAAPKDDDALLTYEWFVERENANARRNKDKRKERLDGMGVADAVKLIKGKK